jgi:hypothetical protein
LVSTPDLQIIDYAIGLPGSQHDATAWQETRIFSEREHLLGPNDFVWEDSAYPLKSWCQAPYKEYISSLSYTVYTCAEEYCLAPKNQRKKIQNTTNTEYN